MIDSQLSENFWLREFLVSQMATRMGMDIIPTTSQVYEANRLCNNVLEPLRAALGRPIVILSGIRPHWLNVAVGGAVNSAHLYGRAADINVVGYRPLEVVAALQTMDLPVDQVIEEFGRWVHIGIAPHGVNPRREFLRAYRVGEVTQYARLA